MHLWTKQKTCGTCEFWNGGRTPRAHQNNIVDIQDQYGECWGLDNAQRGRRKHASNSCKSWRCWRYLSEK